MKLSVIICTRNRDYAIKTCLDAVAASLAHAALTDAEIVVVDNGSTDNTSNVVKEWANSSTVHVKLVFEPRPGLSQARNSGITKAIGELLVFTDDDCCPEPDYFKDCLRHDASATESAIRCGRVELGDPADLPLTIKTSNEPKRIHKSNHYAKTNSLSHAIIGCNMVMRRDIPARIGAFDTRMGAGSPLPGGEDTDFAFRAYMLGIPIEYVPDMVIKHWHGRKSAADGNKLMRNYATGGGAVYAKYLFTNIDFLRPFYWDFKKLLKELVTGKNLLRPEMDFSYKNLIYYNAVGAFKFLKLRLMS